MSNDRKTPRQLELGLFDPDGDAREGELPARPQAGVRQAPQTTAPRHALLTSSSPARPKLRVLEGGGQKRQEPIDSRDAVVRALIEAGADLLLRKISSDRAEEIERRVDRVLHLFDRVDAAPELMPVLRRQLDDLEALMNETRERRTQSRRR